MKIVIASDSFKGSKSSMEVAQYICEGAGRVFPDAEFVSIPIADGGEGTVEALVQSSGGKIVDLEVQDPLGRQVRASYGVINGRAIVELAAASGITVLKECELNPLITSTYGSGEILCALMNAGYRDIVIGIGGSATNDGGAGLAQALGYRFRDERDRELAPGGAALADLHSIGDENVHPALKDTRIEVICDVDNPLLGAQGASAVYGPQKGADSQMVKQLDCALSHFADKVEGWLAAKSGGDGMTAGGIPADGKQAVEPSSDKRSATSSKTALRDFPGAGAAGGLGFGLMAFCGAQLRNGINTMLDLSRFDYHCREADLVITGEGRIDGQSIRGKVPVGVAYRASACSVPVLAIAGSIGSNAHKVYAHGIESIMSAVHSPMSLEEAMSRSHESIADAAERACRMIRLGMKLKDCRKS